MGRQAILFALVGASWAPLPAQAERNSEYQHRFEQVWASAIRLLRVDQGYPIRDRDEEIGYVLFEYQDSEKKAYDGSLELVRVKGKRGVQVRASMKIPAMPSYIEQMLLDKLQKKLDAEYGPPPPPPAAPKEPEEPKPPAQDKPPTAAPGA